MKRIKIQPDDPISIELSERDRTLLIDHTLADPEYANRLRPVGKDRLVAEYTLDDLEDMLGFIAAEANHSNKKLQAELDDLYDRLAEIKDWYYGGMPEDER